jgi:hypothetical protein
MITPGQLSETLQLKRGITFYLPLRIEDADGALMDFTGKEVRFQVADNSDPNADCCDEKLIIDLSSADGDVDLSTFNIGGVSPAYLGNFRVTIAGVAPPDDTNNADGLTLTSQLPCQDTTFRVVVVDPGVGDVPEYSEPYVIGHISITGF